MGDGEVLLLGIAIPVGTIPNDLTEFASTCPETTSSLTKDFERITRSQDSPFKTKSRIAPTALKVPLILHRWVFSKSFLIP